MLALSFYRSVQFKIPFNVRVADTTIDFTLQNCDVMRRCCECEKSLQMFDQA